jgi:RNA polymerase sigma-70 factor (ECF subfamily)
VGKVLAEQPTLSDRAEPDWGRIVAEHGPAVWGTALRILNNHADAQDCYQETFLDAIRSSRRRVTMNWAALLVSIATRRAIDRLRERMSARNLRDEIGLSKDLSAEVRSAGAQTDELDLLDTLRAGLSILPERQAAAFWLRSIEELSYADIAAELKIDANAVGVLLHRARTSLQRHFAADRAAGRELR